MTEAESMLASARRLLGEGRAAAAQSLLDALRREQPAHAEGWFLSGAACHLLGQVAQALDAFERASRIDPRHAQAHNARASMLSLLGRPAEALAAYLAAHTLVPADARILVNIAITLEQLGQAEHALERYGDALERDAECFPALLNRCALLLRLGRNDDALHDADRSVQSRPFAADAHHNRAQALLALERSEQTLVAAGRALALEPNHVAAQVCRALALACLGQLEESREAFERARAADAGVFQAIMQAGWLSVADGRGGWARAASEAPDPRVIYLARGIGRLARCDWQGRDTFLARFEWLIRDGQRRGDPVCEWSLPFAALSLPLSSDVVESIVDALVQRVAATAPAPLPSTRMRRSRSEPLRIGYLTSSFRRHPSVFLNAPILHRYDKSHIQAFGYVLNPPDDSAEAGWLGAAFAAVHHCHGATDEAIARRIRTDGIHILLDISGGYDLSRPEVPRQRPAPINACYMGALLPARADWIDYRIVDAVMAGLPSEEFAADNLVVLGRTCFTYEAGPVAPAPTPTRAEVGLPQRAVVLCCFNGAYKIDPIVFGAWMRLLQRTPASVLWLLGDAAVERNLKAAALAAGVDGARLVFARHAGLQAHLARQRLADLFLDTLPCNAHTSAIEALSCGVPVLTLTGSRSAGRCGASIVAAAGLPELVTTTLAEYEARAFDLVCDPVALAAVKGRLAAQRCSSPLWDAGELAGCLERAFEGMWQRYEAGLEPQRFEVSVT